MAAATEWNVITEDDGIGDPVAIKERDANMMDALLTLHASATVPAYIVAAGFGLWINSAEGTLQLHIGGTDYPIKMEVPVPATADAAGFIGMEANDATYSYKCIAVDEWVRTAVATWV